MVISVLLQRLTAQLTSQRSYCLFNLYKASRQQPHLQLCPSKVYQVARLTVSGSLRCKSDYPGDSSNDNGDSSKLSDDDSTPPSTEPESSVEKLVPSMSSKYKLFENSEEELILDYREELLSENDLTHTDWPSDGIEFNHRERQCKFDSVNLERGQEEVIDIEELVSLLRQENIQDIVVLKLPIELQYSNYMLIASAKSTKHLEAVTAYLVKVWKLKKHQNDIFLQVEGDDSPDWKTLDMNSIMVHLFMPETREKYDLESLWSIGVQFDDLSQKPVQDAGLDLLEKHIEYLKSLKPFEPPVRRADMIPISVRPGTMTRKQIKEMQRELIKSKSSATISNEEKMS